MKTSSDLDKMAEELSNAQRSVATNVNGLAGQILPFTKMQPGMRFSNLRKSVSLLISVLNLIKQYRSTKRTGV